MPEVAEASVLGRQFLTALDGYRGLANIVVSVVEGDEVVAIGMEKLNTVAERMHVLDADEG